MALQPVSQTTVRFAQLATSSLLIIQAAIATAIIGAFALTNLSWLAASSASAQDAQLAIPVPGSVSTSADDLGKPLQTNCQPTKFDEEKPSFCGGVGGEREEPTKTSISTTESPVEPIRATTSPTCRQASNSLLLICLPL